jgi:hypothetical protein
MPKLRIRHPHGSIEATRELCADLDNLIELTRESRAPIRALWLIERARADLQAYLDEIERTTSALPTH